MADSDYLMFREHFWAEEAHKQAIKEAKHEKWRKIFWSENIKAVAGLVASLAAIAVFDLLVCWPGFIITAILFAPVFLLIYIL